MKSKQFLLPIYLYNTLGRKKEEFKPIKKGVVGIYACGPTVYHYAHLGNLRTFIFEDFLRRVFLYNGYKVKQVINITDVGHLLGDADMGEDKMEAGAKREGKSAWEVAQYYLQAYKEDLQALNILVPKHWPRATDHIKEQIALIKILDQKGYLYSTSDGLYFDTSKINNYNKLSQVPLDDLRAGARVEENQEKKNPIDFAVWKFSPKNQQRQLEWDSPWGKGFPGWHLECSAMSLKYLSNNLDIHCGGVDHINTHHTNEIAQSEAATGKKFFNYWLHGAFLHNKDGSKMAKSSGDFLRLPIETRNKKIDPLAFRFLCAQVHYRKPMDYSELSLLQAARRLEKIREEIYSYYKLIDNKKILKKTLVNLELKQQFTQAINDDLNIPKSLAVLSTVLQANLSVVEKLVTIFDFDRVLGLNLDLKINNHKNLEVEFKLSTDLKNLLQERDQARSRKDYKEADKIRQELESRGFIVEDGNKGTVLRKSSN